VMLSTPDAVKSVYEMDGGILAGVAAGKQLVDCATLAPEDMARLSAQVVERGGRFLEAPVTGSKVPARDGQLVFLTAGDEALFHTAQRDLAAMGKASLFLGEAGAATLRLGESGGRGHGHGHGVLGRCAAMGDGWTGPLKRCAAQQDARCGVGEAERDEAEPRELLHCLQPRGLRCGRPQARPRESEDRGEAGGGSEQQGGTSHGEPVPWQISIERQPGVRGVDHQSIETDR